ncbi:MAG TPA: amino acid ABC transporter permease [Burkholderiaceae bacterium]|jgi:glutamate/aspartate transport system permease protein
MNYNWNWSILWSTPVDGTGTYFGSLLWGLAWTIGTSLLAWLIALALGAVIGTLRSLPGKAAAISTAYVELFRNIPLLVQMFLWYFVVPELLPVAAGDWLKSLPNSAFVTAVLSLGFYTSSRVAVQVTSGIMALPRGQRMAGTALGLTLPQTYRYIVLPQAFRIILPPLTNEFVNIVKNSAVASTIGLMELTASTRSMQEFTFQVFEAFTAATLLYLGLNMLVVRFMRHIEKRSAVPGLIAVGSAGMGGK